MDSIADQIGRVGCAIFGGLVPLCQTGQSVAIIGYGLMALIALVAVMWIISRRDG
jgi:hypothetical protein